MIRGIYATLYARLTDTRADLQALFERRYEGEPFVDVMPRGLDARHALGARVERLPDRRAPAAGRRHGDGAGRRGQPRQGRRRPGDPEHEPDVRPPRDHGTRPRCRCCRRRNLALPVWWRRARQHFSIDAPRMAVRSRLPWPWRAVRGRVPPRGRSPACGGGDSTSARSSAASTARRSKPGSRRSKPRTRGCAKDNAQLRSKTTQQETELAMASGAQATLSKQAQELVGRERADQGGARLPAEARRRLQQAGRAVDPAPRGRARARRRVALQRAAGARRQPEGRVRRATSRCRRRCSRDRRAARRRARRSSRCPTSSRTARRR